MSVLSAIAKIVCWLKIPRMIKHGIASKLLSKFPRLKIYVRWSKVRDPRYSNIRKFVLENLGKSVSQLQQDLVAQYLSSVMIKKVSPETTAYFVEIGANDGKYLSNTFTLENTFGWNGLLSEVNSSLTQILFLNRPNSKIDVRAVDEISGIKKGFKQSKNSEYSALEGFSVHTDQFIDSISEEVETINLTDLLEEFKSPKFIDFLSIDTEGNEFDILKGLNFNLFRFNYIAVEVSRNQEEIAEILASNGYIRILEEVSLWDQWWINQEVMLKLKELP
jgi:FkbM family methyltransferase